MKITIAGDWIVGQHPEHGGIDIAKLVPGPLANTAEWEKLIHELAAGPQLAAAADGLLGVWGLLALGGVSVPDVVVDAFDALREAAYIASVEGAEAPHSS